MTNFYWIFKDYILNITEEWESYNFGIEVRAVFDLKLSIWSVRYT